MTTEEKALVKRQPAELQGFESVKQGVQELDKFYKQLMQKGTDFDTIPGTPKPTLLKSGAELLRLRFGFHPQFKISKGLTDIERGFIEYDIVCSLYKDGEIIAEGVGNANSLESKWRYRWVDEKDISKGTDKESLTVKWIKTKTGGSYPKYRMDNENPQDQANTILKIAKKRAFVDAILTATGASRIFTQDIEDMDNVEQIMGEPTAIPPKTTESSTEGIEPSPRVNPLVEAAKEHGAVEIPNIQRLNKTYGVNMDFCWAKGHDDANWRTGQYGLWHPVKDRPPCNFAFHLKPIIQEIVIKELGFPAYDEPTQRKDGKTVQYVSNKFKDWLLEQGHSEPWNKMPLKDKLETLESLMPTEDAEKGILETK